MKKPQIILAAKSSLNRSLTATQKIAEILFTFPDREFSLSDLAKLAGVKKSNMGKILTELQDAGFIEITKLATIWRIKANTAALAFKNAKITYNLAAILESGIADFLSSHYNNVKSISLFGGFRRGEDITGSPIDIAVETTDDIQIQQQSLKQLATFEQKIDRKVKIHLYSRKNIGINQFNEMANGIVIYGTLNVNNLKMDFIA